MQASLKISCASSRAGHWLGRGVALLPMLGTALHACSFMAPSDAELTTSESVGEDSGESDGADVELEASAGDADAETSFGDASDADADAAESRCGPPTDPCSPDDEETVEQPCGLCNTGRQTRKRTCSASCAWEPWSDWAACQGVTAQCEPNHWQCCRTGAWEWCRASTCMWSGDCDTTSCANSPYCDC
jgi:hypothetical protein